MSRKKAELLTGYEIRRLPAKTGSFAFGAFKGKQLIARAQHANERVALRRLVSLVYALHSRQVLEKYGWRCAYCNHSRRLGIHHKIPRSRGGTHRSENLVPACWDCHWAIHNRRPRSGRPGGAA